MYKDGKSIVRVPADRKFLAVEEGCEEFCASAVQYGTGFGLADCDFEYELVCRDLRKIQLPVSVRSVNTEKYWSNSDESSRVNEILFLYNGKADEVVIPDFVKEMEAGVFMDCRFLKEIRLPETMEKMGQSVFYGCFELKSVRFPNGLSEVPDYTFKRCSSLEEVILPDCVTTIGIDAFKGTKIQPSLFQGKKIRK